MLTQSTLLKSPLVGVLRCTAKPRAANLSRPKTFARPKSSKAKGTRNASATLNSSRPVTETEQQTLPWQEYLAIRKSKRRWETAATIPLIIVGFLGGVSYFGNLEMDPTKPIFNIDPMYIYGFATLGCAGAGYLIGPIIGSQCWRITHRRMMKLIEARDREFHKHIVKHRVDPSAQSATNPVPDFYGEKIGSLHDYRQWLRDQAKYKRKAYLPEDEA